MRTYTMEQMKAMKVVAEMKLEDITAKEPEVDSLEHIEWRSTQFEAESRVRFWQTAIERNYKVARD